MTPDAESLKAVFTTNTTWAERSTLAVFVGLLADILVILAFDFFDKDKGWTEIILAGLASLLIAFGVYGEYKFGGTATRASSELQRKSEERIAQLNLGNSDLEQILLPRRLFIEVSSSGNGLKSIKNFAGTKVALVVVPDVEAIRLARDIAQLLEEGKWIGTFAVEARIPWSAIPDGVEIWIPANMRSGKRPDHSSPIFKAGYALSLV